MSKNASYLNDITPKLVDKLITTTLAEKKPSTKQNCFHLIKRLLNKALEWDLIKYNPIAKMKPPKVPISFNIFNKDEVKELIKHTDKPLRTGIKLLVYTGMKSGELFNLRCRDVDLQGGNIKVWPYQGFMPKGKRPRSIPISNAIKFILSELLESKKPDDYIYRPYNHELRLTKRFKILLKKLNFNGCLHDLRYTFASHLAMKSVPIVKIKEFLGHSSIVKTNIYVHFIPNHNQAEVQKLNFG